MAIWDIDLTTHDGAQSATQQGAFACFAAAVLTVIGIALLISATRATGTDAVTALCGAVVEAVVFVVAGLRLRAGKGVIWGGVAALLLAVELVMKLVGFNIVGIVINAGLTIVIVNGVRAALAFRRGIDDPDVIAETFS